MENKHFEFGPFALDAERGVLARHGVAQDVGHRAILLLQTLLRAEGRTVTKAELMDAVWPGRIVEESNLSVQVAALRKRLGVDPSGGEWIATVARVGYRFAGPMSTEIPAPEPNHTGGYSVARNPPSIVVLPLANMGDRPEREYIADGITEDIIMALTRFRWFQVIGRNSSFSFKGRNIGSQAVARELDVRYVLEGSLRHNARQVRITAQLIDAATAKQIWGEQFDLPFAELLRAHDTIARRVAGAIEPELLRTESALAATRDPGGSPTAWDLVHRGTWHFHKIHREGHAQARDFFRQARVVDPTFAPAHLWLARVSAGRVAHGWTDCETDDLQEGSRAALEAIRLDEKNAYTHYALAIVSVYACAFEQAILAAERAVELNPSFALGHLVLGMAQVFSGNAGDAIAPIEHGLEINPFDPQNFVWLITLSSALLFAGDAHKAAEAAERALKVRPDWTPAMEMAVCCLAVLDDGDRYKARLASLSGTRPLVPGDVLAPLKRRNPRWASALASALAGSPEPLRAIARALHTPPPPSRHD